MAYNDIGMEPLIPLDEVPATVGTLIHLVLVDLEVIDGFYFWGHSLNPLSSAALHWSKQALKPLL